MEIVQELFSALSFSTVGQDVTFNVSVTCFVAYDIKISSKIVKSSKCVLGDNNLNVACHVKTVNVGHVFQFVIILHINQTQTKHLMSKNHLVCQ